MTVIEPELRWFDGNLCGRSGNPRRFEALDIITLVRWSAWNTEFCKSTQVGFSSLDCLRRAFIWACTRGLNINFAVEVCKSYALLLFVLVFFFPHECRVGFLAQLSWIRTWFFIDELDGMNLTRVEGLTIDSRFNFRCIEKFVPVPLFQIC